MMTSGQRHARRQGMVASGAPNAGQKSMDWCDFLCESGPILSHQWLHHRDDQDFLRGSDFTSSLLADDRSLGRESRSHHRTDFDYPRSHKSSTHSFTGRPSAEGLSMTTGHAHSSANSFAPPSSNSQAVCPNLKTSHVFPSDSLSLSESNFGQSMRFRGNASRSLPRQDAEPRHRDSNSGYRRLRIHDSSGQESGAFLVTFAAAVIQQVQRVFERKVKCE